MQIYVWFNNNLIAFINKIEKGISDFYCYFEFIIVVGSFFTKLPVCSLCFNAHTFHSLLLSCGKQGSSQRRGEMAVEVGSRNGELENGLKQRESRGRGTIGWVVERRMVEVEEVRMARCGASQPRPAVTRTHPRFASCSYFYP